MREDTIALKMLNSQEFEIDDKTRNGMLYHQRRILSDGEVIFLVNSHKTEHAAARVSVNGKYVLKLDLVNGEQTRYPRGMESLEKIKTTFRTETGKQYGPQFLDLGLAIGQQLHDVILSDFSQYL